MIYLSAAAQVFFICIVNILILQVGLLWKQPGATLFGKWSLWDPASSQRRVTLLKLWRDYTTQQCTVNPAQFNFENFTNPVGLG